MILSLSIALLLSSTIVQREAVLSHLIVKPPSFPMPLVLDSTRPFNAREENPLRVRVIFPDRKIKSADFRDKEFSSFAA